jgi:23S rRNA (uracil1939-C5)-methyltransferase
MGDLILSFQDRLVSSIAPMNTASLQTLEITAIGQNGDGIARLEGQPIYIPYTAPGDVASVQLGEDRADGRRGTLTQILTPGPDRVAPHCPHYAKCGGCALQHISDAAYRDWKLDRLLQPLRRADVQPDRLHPLHVSPPASRRRVVVKVEKRGQKLALGFYEQASHRLVPITACPVLHPALFGLFAPIQTHLAAAMAEKQTADIALTLTRGGVDMTVIAAFPPSLHLREVLGQLADAENIARLYWRDKKTGKLDPVSLRETPFIRFGSFSVTPPPGGFLQATEDGEQALITAALNGVGTAGRVIDLFSGCGTFALSLPEGVEVHAVEGDKAALSALAAAARGQKRITTEQRDLFRDPVPSTDLQDYDAALIDPPRVGAKAQMMELGKSGIPRIVSISCSPTSFARDARILQDAGYRLSWLAPIDQFLWSPHLEAVGLFVLQ